MECWYEPLISIDCAGLAGLLAMPCHMRVDFWPCGKAPWFPTTGIWPTAVVKLANRVKWLYKCPNFASFDIIHIAEWKKRKSYYFARTTSGVKEVVIDGRLVLTPDYKAEPDCYYLGSYPLYWDWKNNTIIYAHAAHFATAWVLGKRPSHPSLGLWTPTREQINEYGSRDPSGNPYYIPFLTDPELIDKLEKWTSDYKEKFGKDPTTKEIIYMGNYYGIKWATTPPGTSFGTKLGFTDPIWDYLDKQQTVIDNMDRVINECMINAYTEIPKKSQGKTKTPFGPAEWPGKPLNELTLPAPVRPPAQEPKPKEILTLKLSMGLTMPPKLDGLEIEIELY